MPSDPARIKPMLDALEEFWTAHPDWRLGQIIQGAADASLKDILGQSVYYVRDEALLKGIHKMEARRGK